MLLTREDVKSMIFYRDYSTNPNPNPNPLGHVSLKYHQFILANLNQNWAEVSSSKTVSIDVTNVAAITINRTEG
jgi:hypothetical protein